MRSTVDATSGDNGLRPWGSRPGVSAGAGPALLCAALLGLWAAGCSPEVEGSQLPPTPAVEPQAAVEFISRGGAHDFGSMAPLSRKKVVFVIQNSASTPLTIKDIKRESEHTTILETGPSVVPPGGSSSVTILFEAPKELGKYVTRVIVLTDDPNKPMIPLVLRATIEP